VDEVQLSRRGAVSGALAALVSLMTARGTPGWAAQPRGNDPRYAFTERLCDLVIPQTDTPGGAGTRAADFVLLAIDTGMSGLDGRSLEAVRESLQTSGGGDFLRLTLAEQARLLESLDARAFTRAASNAPPGAAEAAWQRLKPAIIAGYYTSEMGASQELVYEPVPGPERRDFLLTADYRSRSNEGFGDAL
jgi:hypothetical protein